MARWKPSGSSGWRRRCSGLRRARGRVCRRVIGSKGLVAGMIRERALVPNGWVAERLTMGATGAVSRTIAEARRLAEGERKIEKLVGKIVAGLDEGLREEQCWLSKWAGSPHFGTA